MCLLYNDRSNEKLPENKINTFFSIIQLTLFLNFLSRFPFFLFTHHILSLLLIKGLLCPDILERFDDIGMKIYLLSLPVVFLLIP